MTETWIPLSAAQDQVDKLTNTYLGDERIKDALEKGHVRARAGTFVERVPGQSPNFKQNEFLSLDFWRTAKVSPDPNGGVARQYTLTGKDEFERDQWTTSEAHDIHVLMEDLLKCWPDLSLSGSDQSPDLSPRSTVGPIKRKKGGRPPKHDWIRAAAYATAYMVENDPQPPGLRNALRDWFKANFPEQPDDREVERFVRAYFEEYKNLKRPIP